MLQGALLAHLVLELAPSLSPSTTTDAMSKTPTPSKAAQLPPPLLKAGGKGDASSALGDPVFCYKVDGGGGQQLVSTSESWGFEELQGGRGG